MNDAKTQIVDKLKSGTNILVTVSADPSVDQISACIAMTLLLNKYKKNATAVFSGKVPPALEFLKPKNTLEKTTDSLRDFIIALDKSKADKLRYKVEDDVVKIFITPYRTSITQKDLKYSAGEFNVDVILALGVHHQQDLDRAITAHGRIFHDAVTVSMNNTPQGDLGVANWEDLEASSLSELVADLLEELDPNLLDAEIATALLTGIVAETGRFSNAHTHPRTMTVSSKLLEAGANQQVVNTQLQDLIGVVVNLEAGTEIKPTADTSGEPLHTDDASEELVLDEDGSFKQPGPGPMANDAADGDAVVDAEPADTEGGAEEAEAVKDEKNDGQPVVAADIPDLELPELQSQATAEPAGAGAADDQTTSIESMLGTSVESTPAPVLDEAASAPEVARVSELDDAAGDKPAAADTPVEADADAARQAVESALGTSSSSSSNTSTEPTLSLDNLPVQSASESLIQPISENQPSYASPSTTTQYDMPAQPEHEPAPLGMSPADQPFTMPMPPTSSMPEPSPNTAGSAASSAQTAYAPPPPPLPPPMQPPQFG